MAPSDRFLWVSIGIGAFLAARAIRYVMERHVEATAIEAVEDEVEDVLGSSMERTLDPLHDFPTESPEQEQISNSALRVLTTHHNHQLAWAATAVIVERVLDNHSLINSIRNDALRAQDPEERRQATRALRFLEELTVETFDLDSEPAAVPGPRAFFHPTPTPLTEDEIAQMFDDLSGDRGMRRGILTSLQEEVGEARFGGHDENARQLGIENFAGLEDNRWTTYAARQQAETTRRERREAMVLGQEHPDGSGGGDGWWVLRNLV